MQTIEPICQPDPELPVYEPPTVTTYTDAQLLEALGPATAARYLN